MKLKYQPPPQFFLNFFRWFCHPGMRDHIEGDLTEVYQERHKHAGKRTADLRFIIDVILLFRPGIIRPVKGHENINQYAMIKSYFKIGWRNLLRDKGYSFINIFGLAMGMSVAILIGLWMYDELTYDTYHENYQRIAQVMQHQTFNGEVGTQVANPAVMAEEIRNVHGADFKYVLQSSWNYGHTLTYGEKMFIKEGSYFEPGVAEMLSLKMIYGTRDGLKEMNSIMLSQSVAEAYFGEENPLDKVIKLDNQSDLKVTGVYEDLPDNTSFKQLKFIAPWSLYLKTNPWVEKMENPWGSNFTQTYAQIADNADMETVSIKIKDVKLNKTAEGDRLYKPIVFLHPMSKWHLYSDFKDGVIIGGGIDNVWMFGITGVFVLLLACINFMNLSTARSERRAKEVGIRKSIGSFRGQLVTQFFSESVMVSFLAFIFSIGLVWLALSPFNLVADKNISLPWANPAFWLLGVGFSILTGVFAGLYPALFLSSFQPVKVLKGTFKAGRFASLPRKVLVVVQFTISIMLIIGTMGVYKQIDHAQKRPLGYNRDGLVTTSLNEERYKHAEAIRTDLLASGAVVEMTESGSPTTGVWNTNGGFDWEGKDPNLAVDFPNNGVSHEYGKTIGWEIIEGRDFSREFASDTAAFIMNEAAVKFIGLKDPVGKVLRWENQPFTIIGVIKDMLVQSPYMPVRPSLFHVSKNNLNLFIMKMNPERSTRESMATIESTFKKYDPSVPFESQFVDEVYAQKFGNEQRIGKLAAFFAGLAVLISCLGLFGLASFVAEQRTKEIGIRKVLGASIANVWRMLSKDFVFLVIVSCLFSVPLAWYGLDQWLKGYEYHTDISWWIFAIAAGGALVITLLTVSFQAVKAALVNPVKSLRSE
jgi:ABC-type antimicrobial peptide transport system permease subunit